MTFGLVHAKVKTDFLCTLINFQSIITVEKFGDTDVGNFLVDCH